MKPVRQIFDVPLAVAVGSTLQPTGFPDLGAAVFTKPDGRDADGNTRWVDALLVESAQSMANRLEATAWDDANGEPVEEVAGLPYVRVIAEDGDYVTSSRTEAHRLASAFVKDAELDGASMVQVLKDRLRLRDDRPIPPRDVAREVFALDPFCLVHGVFFADNRWPGQPKIARAITGLIEASDVRAMHSGGVKTDQVRHSINEQAKGSTEGYGTIPYHRTEYVAADITASFSLDLAQIRSYGLGSAAETLLGDLARWELRRFLEGGLRLRTACDLELAIETVADRDGEPLPSDEELTERVRQGIDGVGELLEDREPLTVTWTGGRK